MAVLKIAGKRTSHGTVIFCRAWLERRSSDNGALETLREDMRRGTRAISTDWLDSEPVIEGSCVALLTSRCIRLETSAVVVG